MVLVLYPFSFSTMKNPAESGPLSAKHKNKIMLMALLTGIAVGAWALFEKPILEFASQLFGSC